MGQVLTVCEEAQHRHQRLEGSRGMLLKEFGEIYIAESALKFLHGLEWVCL